MPKFKNSNATFFCDFQIMCVAKKCRKMIKLGAKR